MILIHEILKKMSILKYHLFHYLNNFHIPFLFIWIKTYLLLCVLDIFKLILFHWFTMQSSICLYSTFWFLIYENSILLLSFKFIINYSLVENVISEITEERFIFYWLIKKYISIKIQFFIFKLLSDAIFVWILFSNK